MADIVVPVLGESVTEATVARWLKQAGEAITAGEPLVELETDKVTLEINAEADGVLGEIVAGEGSTVGVGAVLGRTGGASAAATAPAKGNGKVTAADSGKGAAQAPGTASSAESEGGQPGKIQPQPQTTNAPAPKASAPKAGAPQGATAGKDGGQTIDISVPTLGESISEATVGAWAKKVGETVKADELLVTLETEKVGVDVNAPTDGVLAAIEAAEGANVAVGAVLARITAGAGAAGSRPAAPAAAAAASAAPARSAAAQAGPAARKAADEAGLALDQIQGSGKDGRVTKADVATAGQQRPAQLAAAPSATATSAATTAPAAAQGHRQEERVRMTRLRQTIARRLKEAQNNAAMLTTFNEVDMSHVMALRNQYKDVFEKKNGIKIGFMSFFVKAAIQALREFPAVNASIDGTDIVYHNFFDIGVAVSTPNGLVVPVLRNAEERSFADIEKSIADLGGRARDGRLSLDELQGGTFSITNGGVFGSLMSTPILNPPQSGILGMHKIQERPIVVGGKIEIRPMMYLALSYDHRIVDGREAVSVLVRIKEAVEDPQRLLLEV